MGFFSKLLDNMYKSLTGEDLNDLRKAKRVKDENLSLGKNENDKLVIEYKDASRDIPWEKYESIYSYILSNCHRDEFISGKFSLPEDNIKSEEDKWGPTNKYRDEGINNVDELITNSISSNLVNCCISPSEKNMITFYNSLISTNILIVMDGILDNVVSRQDEISIENLYLTGVWLCRDTCHRSAVVFGIALLGRIRLEDDIIQVLSKCTDFIYPLSIAILTEGKNSASKLIKISENVDGWDKIQLIEYIVPETISQKKWFLTKGIKCSVGNAYLSRICAEKSDLIENIGEYMNGDATRSGITLMINSFLEESGFKEFKKFSYNKGLIKAYVNYLCNEKLSKDEKKAFKAIHSFITTKYNGNDLDIIAKIIDEKLKITVKH